MRQSIPVFAAFVLLAGCVTINVYFPAAAAQEAAQQFIGDVIGADAATANPAPKSAPPKARPASAAAGAASDESFAARVLDALVPAAHAASAPPDLTVRSAEIDAIKARMRQRYEETLAALLDSGAVGLTHNGDVAIHDAGKISLPARAAANKALAAENVDRADLYRRIAAANGHPEWATQMREAFAKQWINMARAGWYYQDASGNWKRK